METRRDRVHLCGERQWAGREARQVATPQRQRGECGSGTLFCVGQRVPRPGKVGIKRPFAARRVDGPAQQRRRGGLGRRRQRLRRLIASPVTGRHRSVCRFGLGGQRGVCGDQPPHRPKNGGGRQRVARRLGYQREAKFANGVRYPRSQARRIGLHLGQVIRRLQHDRALRHQGIDGVLHREYQRILRQRRISGSQPLDFDCLALTVSGGVTLRGDQRLEPTFGVGRQMRCVRQLREALACLGELRQQRCDAAHPLEAVVLLGQSSNLLLDAGQFRHRGGMRGLRLLPGARRHRALLAFALRLAPGFHRVGQAAPAAAVADQRFCLLVKLSQRSAKIEQASAGQKAFTGLTAKLAAAPGRLRAGVRRPNRSPVRTSRD